MTTTLQGSEELKASVSGITDELKSIADLAHGGFNTGREVLAKLDIRINDEEGTKASRIAPLAATLAELKVGLVAAANSLTVPTDAEFQALAETPDPAVVEAE